jgi:hypothetical protein
MSIYLNLPEKFRYSGSELNHPRTGEGLSVFIAQKPRGGLVTWEQADE